MKDEGGQDLLWLTILWRSSRMGKLPNICQAPALIFTFLDVRSKSSKQTHSLFLVKSHLFWSELRFSRPWSGDLITPLAVTWSTQIWKTVLFQHVAQSPSTSCYLTLMSIFGLALIEAWQALHGLSLHLLAAVRHFDPWKQYLVEPGSTSQGHGHTCTPGMWLEPFCKYKRI